MQFCGRQFSPIAGRVFLTFMEEHFPRRLAASTVAAEWFTAAKFELGIDVISWLRRHSTIVKCYCPDERVPSAHQRGQTGVHQRKDSIKSACTGEGVYLSWLAV